MKERRSNVLAWLAFLHGVICLCVLGMGMNLPLPFEVRQFVLGYVGVVGADVIEAGVLLYTPLIWAFLYVLNGKPRVLPWMK